MNKWGWIMLGAVALAPATRAEDPRQRWTPSEVAEVIAESSLRMDNPLVTFRDVRVHPQASPDTYAVCGQANPEGQEDTPYRTFVVSVVVSGNEPPSMERFFGQDAAAATRTDMEAAARCHPGGGPGSPPNAARQGQPEAAPRAASAVRPPTQAASPDQMTMRQGASLHAGPSGAAQVIRSVHRGTRVQVFRRAPGGWLEIGDDRPWGWMHQSMMTR